MVIGIFGESCTGKSTLANELVKALGGETAAGRDYLRSAKSESEAVRLFREKLQSHVNGENFIYVMTETEQLVLLPGEAVRVYACAQLCDIKSRFAARMHGNMPKPVEQMLEKKHGMFENEPCTFRYDSSRETAADAAAEICKELGAGR